MRRPATGAPRVPWQPPAQYDTGPHRWAVVPIWQGATVNTWLCMHGCGVDPVDQAAVRSDCPAWSDRTVRM